MGGNGEPFSGGFQGLFDGRGWEGGGCDGAGGDAPQADGLVRVSHPIVQWMQL